MDHRQPGTPVSQSHSEVQAPVGCVHSTGVALNLQHVGIAEPNRLSAIVVTGWDQDGQEAGKQGTLGHASGAVCRPHRAECRDCQDEGPPCGGQR